MGVASAMVFITALLSAAIMGIPYFANGGFPAINLLFDQREWPVRSVPVILFMEKCVYTRL